MSWDRISHLDSQSPEKRFVPPRHNAQQANLGEARQLVRGCGPGYEDPCCDKHP